MAANPDVGVAVQMKKRQEHIPKRYRQSAVQHSAPQFKNPTPSTYDLLPSTFYLLPSTDDLLPPNSTLNFHNKSAVSTILQHDFT